MSKLKALLLIILLSAGISGNASAATFTVNSETDANLADCSCATPSGLCTLREAIREANALAGEDTIILPAGNYILTIAGEGEDAAATGDLDITDAAGLIIQGAGSASTIVDGNGIDRVFHIQPGASADISGITIQGGIAPFTYGDHFGGGIFNYGGTLTITGCTISGNTSVYSDTVPDGGYGGGVSNYGGTVTITDSTISGNTTVSSSTYGYFGFGGGIYNESGTMTITDCTVSGNLVTGDYGAAGGIDNVGTMIIQDSTIKDNTSAMYAGILNGGDMTIINCTIFNNSSTDFLFVEFQCGSGISNSNNITVQNSTIVDNKPSNVANGDYCWLYSGVFIINNSIVASTDPTNINCVFEQPPFLIPFDSSSTNNLSTDATCGDVFMQNTVLEINLGALTNNGGQTETMALLTGSVAIDAGDNSSCPATDQRGVSRIQGAQCDIGAFELAQGSAQTITVTTTAPGTATYNEKFTVSATASSGLAVTIAASGACSGSGTGSVEITMTSGTGTCTVKYDQAGDGTYSPAPQVSESTNAGKANQTIGVTTPAPVSAAYNANFTVAATGGGSENPVTYSKAGGCTNVGDTFKMTSGTDACSVKYDQAGNDNYNPAPQVTETVTAQKIGQTITVTQNTPASAAYNGSFSVSAIAGLDVAITTSGACTGGGIGSATITMTCANMSCIVHYNQAGDSNYNAASEITETAAVRSVLTITPSGTGIGTVSGSGLDCSWNGDKSSGTCLRCYNDYTFDLNIQEGACSFFNGWETAYAEDGNSCSVTVKFDLYSPVRVSSTQVGYATIYEAYFISGGGTLDIQAHPFGEALTLDQAFDVTFDSGWNCNYSRVEGYVSIPSLMVQLGSLTLQNGVLVVKENIP